MLRPMPAIPTIWERQFNVCVEFPTCFNTKLSLFSCSSKDTPSAATVMIWTGPSTDDELTSARVGLGWGAGGCAIANE